MEYINQQTFSKQNFSTYALVLAEYESCVFSNCDFSNCNLSNYKFLECEFVSCNLSLAQLKNTALCEAVFKDCKMLGLHFENCLEFGLSFTFDNCNLNHSSFYKTKIKKTVFKNSQLQEVDFSETELSASIFANCDCLNAKFERTNLEKCDFRTAFNFSINPNTNKIKKAKFSTNNIAGLLHQFDVEIY
jgi:hypothetical protein